VTWVSLTQDLLIIPFLLFSYLSRKYTKGMWVDRYGDGAVRCAGVLAAYGPLRNCADLTHSTSYCLVSGDHLHHEHVPLRCLLACRLCSAPAP
jgi:hypothetical protein